MKCHHEAGEGGCSIIRGRDEQELGTCDYMNDCYNSKGFGSCNRYGYCECTEGNFGGDCSIQPLEVEDSDAFSIDIRPREWKYYHFDELEIKQLRITGADLEVYTKKGSVPSSFEFDTYYSGSHFTMRASLSDLYLSVFNTVPTGAEMASGTESTINFESTSDPVISWVFWVLGAVCIIILGLNVLWYRKLDTRHKIVYEEATDFHETIMGKSRAAAYRSVAGDIKSEH